MAHGGFLLGTSKFCTMAINTDLTETFTMHSDSAAIHALSQDATELPGGPSPNNLTVIGCTATCSDAGTMSWKYLMIKISYVSRVYAGRC